MSNLGELKKTADYSVSVKWEAVEEKLGFKLHDELKKLYSRILIEKPTWDFTRFSANFIKSYLNPKFDDWFAEDTAEGKSTDVKLYLLSNTDEEYLYDFFDEGFNGDWTGDNDFGSRMLIGSLELSVGEILIIFNNDNGEYELNDCGYGYFPVYEDNPTGIIADSTEEFLSKLIPED